MEILYPNSSLDHLESMEVTNTTVHGKETPKNFCPEAQDRAQTLVSAWNSLLELNWSAKRQLEFPPGSTTELGRWNKTSPAVPRFSSWELQVPTGSCTHSQGSEIQKDLQNWAQLFSMGWICLEVEGKIEAILWQFFFPEKKNFCPFTRFVWKPGSNPEEWLLYVQTCSLQQEHIIPQHLVHPSPSLQPGTPSSWQGRNFEVFLKAFFRIFQWGPGKVGNLNDPELGCSVLSHAMCVQTWWNLLGLSQESTKTEPFAWIWGALWDGRHPQLIWDRVIQKHFPKCLHSASPPIYLLETRLREGNHADYENQQQLRHFQERLPTMRQLRAVSCCLIQPNRRKISISQVEQTGVCSQVSAKADFPPPLICKSPNVGCSTNRPLSFNNQDFKTKQKNPAKAKDFFKLEQIRQTLSKEEFFWCSSRRLFLAQHQRLGL